MQRNPTGEARIFEKIWQNRPHVCSNCSCNLHDPPSPAFFSHIIRKSKREDLRLDPENILLECHSCHSIWDNGTIQERVQMHNFMKKLSYIERKDSGLAFTLKAAHEEFGYSDKFLFKTKRK